MTTEARCPFYGFYMHPVMSLMVSQGGNQCALITDSYAPCRMEVSDQTPDWKGCSFFNNPRNAEVLKKIEDSMRVFPKDTAVDSTPKEGVALSNWMQRFS